MTHRRETWDVDVDAQKQKAWEEACGFPGAWDKWMKASAQSGASTPTTQHESEFLLNEEHDLQNAFPILQPQPPGAVLGTSMIEHSELVNEEGVMRGRRVQISEQNGRPSSSTNESGPDYLDKDLPELRDAYSTLKQEHNLLKEKLDSNVREQMTKEVQWQECIKTSKMHIAALKDVIETMEHLHNVRFVPFVDAEDSDKGIETVIEHNGDVVGTIVNHNDDGMKTVLEDNDDEIGSVIEDNDDTVIYNSPVSEISLLGNCTHNGSDQKQQNGVQTAVQARRSDTADDATHGSTLRGYGHHSFLVENNDRRIGHDGTTPEVRQLERLDASVPFFTGSLSSRPISNAQPVLLSPPRIVYPEPVNKDQPRINHTGPVDYTSNRVPNMESSIRTTRSDDENTNMRIGSAVPLQVSSLQPETALPSIHLASHLHSAPKGNPLLRETELVGLSVVEGIQGTALKPQVPKDSNLLDFYEHDNRSQLATIHHDNDDDDEGQISTLNQLRAFTQPRRASEVIENINGVGAISNLPNGQVRNHVNGSGPDIQPNLDKEVDMHVKEEPAPGNADHVSSGGLPVSFNHGGTVEGGRIHVAKQLSVDEYKPPTGRTIIFRDLPSDTTLEDVFDIISGGPINRCQLFPEQGTSRQKAVICFIHPEHEKQYFNVVHKYGVSLKRYPDVRLQVELGNGNCQLTYGLYKRICSHCITRCFELRGLPGPDFSGWSDGRVQKFIVTKCNDLIYREPHAYNLPKTSVQDMFEKCWYSEGVWNCHVRSISWALMAYIVIGKVEAPEWGNERLSVQFVRDSCDRPIDDEFWTRVF